MHKINRYIGSFGLNLFNDSNGNAGDDGYFKCKPDNDYIGNYNISFIVEEEYGRSLFIFWFCFQCIMSWK